MNDKLNISIPGIEPVDAANDLSDSRPGCVNRRCSEIFEDPRARASFGIIRPRAPVYCHDICVEEVRFISAKNLQLEVPIPSRGTCRRGPVTCPTDLECEVFLTCAKEELREDCMAVIITLGFQVILTSQTNNNVIVVNATSPPLTFDTFYEFPSRYRFRGNDLRQALREIDGSCIVIQNLNCAVENTTQPHVDINALIVDKLWRHQNLWVQALNPYDAPTVEHKFPFPHKIGPCAT